MCLGVLVEVGRSGWERGHKGEEGTKPGGLGCGWGVPGLVALSRH